MNLHLLRIFVSVVEAGSFSRAAEALEISQPAVSKAVRELESQLDTTLLDRQGRSFKPSEPGQALYDYGRSIFALEREAQETLEAFYGLERGHLTIGASTTVATYWLPPLIAEFHSRHPHIEIRLVSENTKQIIELLIDCRLDVALVEGQVADSRVEARHWFKEDMVVIAADSPERATPAQVIDAQTVWVVREHGSGSREATEALLRELDIQPPHTIEVGSNEAIVQTVSSGIGLGLVPRICARDQLRLGQVKQVDIGRPAIERQLYRVRLPHRTISQAGIAFEAMLSQWAPDH
ncbi:LysR substrate-binding domain-containing protein [Billgrantia aerodenitrificans]|uniref:LysR family transcriptional regulator n=1 Tax=Billgrantia aerodenitrificans TaxID=2733483 RepID=A0ABS9AP68_9GAMM|nr:LysR substrate-binding domain-containing protein [Halomonas aerodenitrificans]MCE8023378.1 LysR family transcriptional regulator [Halomonas aerodenitrificans]